MFNPRGGGSIGSGVRRGADKVRVKENQEKVLELRVAGLSVRAIGKAMGLSKSQAHRLLERSWAELGERVQAKAERALEMELERCDAVQVAHWANRANPRNAQIIIAVMDRRAKLLGLDRPTKLEIQDTTQEEQYDFSGLTTEELVLLNELWAKVKHVETKKVAPTLAVIEGEVVD